MRKKVVFLPYDFDTAIGTNNEGALQFSYNLEDIDKIGNNTDVYNGQDSVLWKNVRAAFYEELKAMYQQLRSQGAISYEKIERMFEEHQGKWPEAIFNEDSYYTYLKPYVDPDAGKTSDASYLSMLQGSKANQRKWWLYNRFRYIDSKYNAGDALTDVITLRGYAKSNISITPYADIYATVKYGSYLVQERANRNQTYTLVCPLSNVNDTEIYVYSASQLASVGDLSGLMVGYANFANATRLQNLKCGDSSNSYENDVMLDLFVGNNVLLETIDCRNCVNLGGSRNVGGNTIYSTTPTIDLSKCVGLKNAYFDNTSVKGITLPNGSIIEKLHLNRPTNITLQNCKNLSDFTVTSFADTTTLWIENCSNTVNPLTILDEIPENSRVRIIGFDMSASTYNDIVEFYDELDTMRGLDENGNTVEKANGGAQVSGTIHINALTGAQIAELNSRYPYIEIDAAHVESFRYFRSWDGQTLLKTVSKIDGVMQDTAPSNPSRSSTAQYDYSFIGWSNDMDSYTADVNLSSVVKADDTVYAAYSRTVRTYTVTWKNSNNTTLETDTNVPYGATPTYNGATPVDPSGNNSPFTTWTPALTDVTGNATYTASFKPVWTVTFKSQDGATTLDTKQVVDGGTATYTGTTPTNADNTTFLGWSASSNATAADSDILTNITANKTVYAAFESLVEDAEITDSWEQIINSIEDGTYSTKYKLGNYKPLDLGTEGTINMQIVAMDGDVDVNGDTIPLSFIGKELLNNSTYTPAYSNKSLDTKLNNLYTTFPSSIKNNVVSAYKTSLENSNSISSTSYKKLWSPSAREITSSGSYEGQGIRYTSVFTNNNSRVKTKNGTNSAWGTRSKTGSNNYSYVVYSDGSINTGDSYSEKNICIGFCLGTEAQARTISVNELLTSIDDGTYSTKFSVGDMFPLDLGTEGQVHAQIVAFDADDKADGSGKAKVSVITKELLNTTHKMNDTNTTTGGWPATSMRSYLNTTISPKIPSAVSNRIVEVTKTYKDYTNGQQTSNDTLWIPSDREVTGSTDYETSGPIYSGVFTNNASKVKKKSGSASYWWLRSASNSSSFRNVSIDGNVGNYYAYYSLGVALGFCLD